MRLFHHNNSEIPSYSTPSTIKYRIALHRIASSWLMSVLLLSVASWLVWGHHIVSSSRQLLSEYIPKTDIIWGITCRIEEQRWYRPQKKFCIQGCRQGKLHLSLRWCSEPPRSAGKHSTKVNGAFGPARSFSIVNPSGQQIKARLYSSELS